MKLSEIIRRQPTNNFGVIGHVSHGKSTLTKAITRVATQKYKKELERNITILLGYANVYIYTNQSGEIIFSDKLLDDDPTKVLISHASFVDCPGHKALMSVMIAGSKVMDGAIVIVSLESEVPQEQTKSHVDVLKYTDIGHVMVALNKVDLFTKDKKSKEIIKERIEEVEKFVSEREKLRGVPVMPISAFKNKNIDEVGKFIANMARRDLNTVVNKELLLCGLRTFDVNQKGVKISDMSGGVIGGSILQGHVSVGDKVIVTPGVLEEEGGKWVSRPIFGTVKKIMSGTNTLEVAVPGGLVSVELDIDPSYCKGNGFLGNIILKLTKANYSDYISNERTARTLKLKIKYLEEKDPADYKDMKELTMIINSQNVKGRILRRETDKGGSEKLKVQLKHPVFVTPDDQYPILFERDDGVEDLCAIGKVRNVVNDVEIKLPSGFPSFVEQLPETLDELVIEDDLPVVNFDLNKFSMGNLEENISELTESKKVVQKLNLPQPEIMDSPTQFMVKNIEKYATIYDKVDGEVDLPNLRLYTFKNSFPHYVRYEYGIDESNGVNYVNETLTIQKKAKRTKLTPDTLILQFFGTYNKCKQCGSYTCKLGKIENKVFKVCFHCSQREVISEIWTKDLRF
jgi:translation initiation factor 2 subunit 3